METEMKKMFRALIVDDDPDSAEFLRFKLNKAFPNLDISVRNYPDTSGEYDLFFIDNDFDGACLAAELARTIVSATPQALIVAFSACLDTNVLKALLNLGCDWACDKSDPREIDIMMEVVGEHLRALAQNAETPSQPLGFMGTIQSITDLLRQWNKRLEYSAMRTTTFDKEGTAESSVGGTPAAQQSDIGNQNAISELRA